MHAYHTTGIGNPDLVGSPSLRSVQDDGAYCRSHEMGIDTFDRLSVATGEFTAADCFNTSARNFSTSLGVPRWGVCVCTSTHVSQTDLVDKVVSVSPCAAEQGAGELSDHIRRWRGTSARFRQLFGEPIPQTEASRRTALPDLSREPVRAGALSEGATVVNRTAQSHK